MKTIIADYKNLEGHSLFVKFVRIFSVPILNNLPANFLQRFMRASSYDAEVVLCDITQKLPFSDNYFSKIVSNNTIYALNYEQQKNALSEIHRVLKPGGKFVVSNVKKGFSPVKIYSDYISKSVKEMGLVKTAVLFFKLAVPTIKMFFYNAKIKNSGAAQYNFFEHGEQKKDIRKERIC